MLFDPQTLRQDEHILTQVDGIARFDIDYRFFELTH